jgi:hypothetical protein
LGVVGGRGEEWLVSGRLSISLATGRPTLLIDRHVDSYNRVICVPSVRT